MLRNNLFNSSSPIEMSYREMHVTEIESYRNQLASKLIQRYCNVSLAEQMKEKLKQMIEEFKKLMKTSINSPI